MMRGVELRCGVRKKGIVEGGGGELGGGGS